MPKKNYKNKGFTLIEIIIVIVLIGIIAIFGNNILIKGFQGFRLGKDFVSAEEKGQVALERLTRDLRSIPVNIAINTANNTQISFTDFNNDIVTYNLSGSNLLRSGDILASDIQSLSFSYYAKNGTLLTSPINTSLIGYIVPNITINQNGVSINLKTGVFPWDLN